MRQIEAGETLTLSCQECGQEWLVTYEPKAERDRRSAGVIEPTQVHCPGCGHDTFDDDDDE